eukprot:gb/GFBE01015021.1/.p1 GENE.gb/GFBE01015021.1/~~gb/GFBE01015021.1/.p1  ORF type:complete len:354 (+),score=49.32 gb/GFBE01015021.1/:1-1062(+)
MNDCLLAGSFLCLMHLWQSRSMSAQWRRQRAAVWSDSARRVAKSLRAALPQTDSPLLEDVLPDVVNLLPCALFGVVFAVCREWYDLLDCEKLWRQACRSQWPGAVAPLGGSWRRLMAQLSSGEMLCKCLRAIPEEKCSSGHVLRRFATDVTGFHCDVCGRRNLPIGSAMWGCRMCNYDKCLACHHAPSKRTVPQETCPAGHDLHCFMTAMRGFHCDDCGTQEIPVGTAMWGCRACNYDKCIRCHRPPQVAPYVLARGAKNYCDDEGWTVLHHACRLGFPDVVAGLLDSETDVDVKDLRYGFTPLMIGATHGHADVCSLLLAHKASKEHKNQHGSTALDCAARWGHAELESLLR